MQNRRFTSFEDNFIRCTYLFYTGPELARLLGRSVGSVYGRIYNLGLIIPVNVKKERYALNYDRNLKTGGAAHRFKKGNAPHNKGKKTDPDLKKRIQHTFFSKGHKPANTLYDHAITVRKDTRGIPQRHIRISEGEWEYLSRYNYSQHHGSIPNGMVVAFRDGNTLNCDIDNLYLLTKKQNMLRNQISQYPKPLQQTIRTLSKLKKQIKNVEKQ